MHGFVFDKEPVHVIVGVRVQQCGRGFHPQAGRRAARRALRQGGGAAYAQRIAHGRGQLGQQRFFRPAQVPALRVADVQFAHHGQVFGGLDAFGHDGRAQMLSHLQNGAHHALLAVVVADAVEEVAVDLDQVGLHFGPQLQIRIAHAVVVQRDAHAVLAQAGKRIAQFLHVIRQRVLLGQFNDDAGRGQCAILKQLLRHIAAPQRPIVDQR
ncbi:hypothetical protein D3C71_1143410 [compost metagenome]